MGFPPAPEPGPDLDLDPDPVLYPDWDPNPDLIENQIQTQPVRVVRILADLDWLIREVSPLNWFSKSDVADPKNYCSNSQP